MPLVPRADRPEYATPREELAGELRPILDPSEVDARAKADQRRRAEISVGRG